MTEHQASCATCARIAQTEARMRERWRVAAPPTSPDLWPQISARLEASERRSVRPTVPVPLFRRALKPLAAMAALGTAVSVFGWWQGAGPFPHSPAHGTVPEVHIVSMPPVERTASTGTAVSFPALADVSSEDPAVDDPAGTDMDQVWAQLHATAGTGMEKK